MNEVKLKFKKEALDIISSSNFYYDGKISKDGECFKNTNDIYRSIALLNILSSNTYDAKYISARTLRDIKYNYRPLLENLIDRNVIEVVENSTDSKAAKFKLNEIYHGECTISLSDKQLKLVNISREKRTKRGMSATTDKPISIHIDKDTFKSEYRSYLLKKNKELNVQQYKSVWKSICRINKTGKINPDRRRETRLYSDITCLPSFLHAYLRIDGEPVIEIDQHATYLTLLPKFFKMNSPSDGFARFEHDMMKFRAFLDSDNVYKMLSDFIGVSDLQDVKVKTQVFICEKQKHMSGTARKIYDWFGKEFPTLLNILDMNRKNAKVSYSLMRLESAIFIDTARKAKKAGCDVITKHDAIFVTKKDLSVLKDMLEQAFIKHDVKSKLKIKTVQTNSHAGREQPSRAIRATLTESRSNKPLNVEITVKQDISTTIQNKSVGEKRKTDPGRSYIK